MRKSVTTLAVLALGAMVAVGSATESMAHGGGGGGHGGGGSHSGDSGGGHGFGGGGRGFGGRGDHGFGRGIGGGDHSFGGRSHGGMFGSGGIFGSARGVMASHDRFDGRRDHFRDFRRDDNYGYCDPYSCN